MSGNICLQVKFFDIITFVAANATCLTVSDGGPRNSSLQWARGTPVVVRRLEHHPGDGTIWLGEIPTCRKFKVFSDHKPLAGFLSNKNPSSKILRWKLALEEFNYDIHYIRGSLNSVADHLSRYINNITIALPDSKDLINMQREDSVLSTIIQKIDQNDVSPQISNYFINGEGLLCHLSKRPSRSPRSNTTRKQVCIPHCLKAKILESVHSEYGGHLKFFKTYHRLSENFFWHNMYKDTKNFVRSCTICLSRKNAFKIPPAPHQLVEQSTEPGETCHMDIFGPLKTTLKGCRNGLTDAEINRGSRLQWVRSLVGLITSAGTGEYFPPLQSRCRNCGGGDRGRVAIYRPFGELRRAKIVLSPVWCSRPTTGVPLAHATMNFVGLDLTASDRWHQTTTTTTINVETKKMYIQARFGSYRSIESTKTDWNCTRKSIFTCFAQTSDRLPRLTQTYPIMSDVMDMIESDID
ncbi:integrase catalytic domain-containing protein [Trichonephila clavipes]|nr:integrase catalytic domain-containing protein [Trichonephila clavipes]